MIEAFEEQVELLASLLCQSIALSHNYSLVCLLGKRRLFSRSGALLAPRVRYATTFRVGSLVVFVYSCMWLSMQELQDCNPEFSCAAILSFYAWKLTLVLVDDSACIVLAAVGTSQLKTIILAEVGHERG